MEIVMPYAYIVQCTTSYSMMIYVDITSSVFDTVTVV